MRKAVEAWKQKRSAYYDMYIMILLTHYGIYFWLELAHAFLHFQKLIPIICGNPFAFLWLLDLQLLSVLYPDIHQFRVKINKIKWNQDTDHISIFTRPIIPSCLHTTHVNSMIRRRVNTDLPPFKSGEHNLMRNAAMIRWIMITNTTGMKWLGGFHIDEHRINNTGWMMKWWWNGGVERKAKLLGECWTFFNLHFPAPAMEAMSRICTYKTERNLLIFGWCSQFKQSCPWATLSYFCLQKQVISSNKPHHLC